MRSLLAGEGGDEVVGAGVGLCKLLLDVTQLGLQSGIAALQVCEVVHGGGGSGGVDRMLDRQTTNTGERDGVDVVDEGEQISLEYVNAVQRLVPKVAMRTTTVSD